MKKLLLPVLSMLLSFAYADVNGTNHPQHQLTTDDKAAMPFYLRQISQYGTLGTTTPPVTPVRASAEWEQIDALVEIGRAHV